MDRDRVYEAIALRTAVWRRDFWRDKTQVARIHSELTGSLGNEIKSAIRDYDNMLHPNHTLHLESEKLALNDHGSALLTCHVGTENIGYIVLQYIGRSGNETKQQLQLECTSKTEFAWVLGSLRVPTHEIASYILRTLINLAVVEVEREVAVPSS